MRPAKLTMGTYRAIGEPDAVDCDDVARLEIAAQHRDVVAVVQTPGDSDGTKSRAILDPHMG